MTLIAQQCASQSSCASNSPSAPSHAMQLPDEIIARFVGAAFDQTDSPAKLFACLATVCRTWLDPCRRTLHTRYSVKLPLRDDGRLEHFLVSADAASYVQRCTIVVPSYPFSVHRGGALALVGSNEQADLRQITLCFRRSLNASWLPFLSAALAYARSRLS